MRKLLITPSLVSGEFWGGYLYHLARVNHYRPESLFIKSLNQQLKGLNISGDVVNPTNPETFIYLSELIGQPIRSIYTATIHSLYKFLPIRGLASIPLEIHQAEYPIILDYPWEYLYFHTRLQFCPLCLIENLRIPKLWLFKLYSVCTIHKCLLYGVCPNCLKQIDISTLQSQKCKYCKAILTEAQPYVVSANNTALAAANSISQLINSQNLPIDNYWNLPTAMTQQAVLSLMSLVFTFVKNTHTKGGFRILMPELDIPKHIGNTGKIDFSIYDASGAAYRVLENWPQRFYEFLDYVRLVETGRTYRLSYSGLNRFFHEWFLSKWLYPEFLSLHQAFRPYYQQELLKNPHLEPTIYEKYLQSNEQLFESHKYQADFETWLLNRQISLEKVSQLLQLPLEYVGELRQSGLISSRIRSSNPHLADYFSSLSLLQRVRSLLRNPNARANELLSFQDIMDMQISASKLTRAILFSTIPVYSLIPASATYFSDLKFSYNDLGGLMKDD